MKKLTFLQNTIILVLSNLITGALGFMFSIILSNEVGAQGVGLFQLIMPIYSLFICLTCGGVTTAISKMIAEQNSRNNIRELYKTISTSIAFFSFWTIFISILITFFAPILSTYILKDVRTYLGILTFIPALLFVAIGSIMKGYFYGLQDMTFPPIIDIGEKFVRIVVLITLVTALKPMGLKYQVAGAIAAMTCGEITSCTLLYLFYRKSRRGIKQFVGTADNALQIIANVLTISIPLCINGLLYNILGSFITVMIPRRLQDAGYTLETSLALYGKINGMGMNVVSFPSIIIGAVSTLLVPAISEAASIKNIKEVNNRIHQSLKITTAVAAVSTGLFFSIPDELGMLFYSRNDLGNMIFSLAFGVMFSYVEATLQGILNGLGKQAIILRNTMIMSAIDIVSLYILLGMPQIGIYAISINFVISPLIGCVLNLYEIKKITETQIHKNEIIIFPLVLCSIEIMAVKNLKPVIFKLIENPSTATVATIFTGVFIFCGIYFLVNPLFKKFK